MLFLEFEYAFVHVCVRARFRSTNNKYIFLKHLRHFTPSRALRRFIALLRFLFAGANVSLCYNVQLFAGLLLVGVRVCVCVFFYNNFFFFFAFICLLAAAWPRNQTWSTFFCCKAFIHMPSAGLCVCVYLCVYC